MKENNINMIGKGLNREGKECHMHENYENDEKKNLNLNPNTT